MTTRISAKQRLFLGTTLAGAAVFLLPSAAYADCLPTNAAQTDVQCSTNDPDGYQTATNGVGITVLSGVTVGAGTGTPSPLLAAGTGSLVGNFGNINSGVGSIAISLGGGSTVNNAAVPGGTITGDVVFGGTTTDLNVFNNLGGTATLTGNITSTGGLTINNTGPGLNAVGPATTYAVLTDFQTWICTLAMLIGRLEIFTLLIIFTPRFWQR